MKQILALMLIGGLMAATGWAVTVPQPPDVNAIAAMVTRPAKPGNAAEFYLKAEGLISEQMAKYTDTDGKYLDEDAEVYQLVMQGLEHRVCVFPYATEMKLPPYDQRTPLMLLYGNAIRTFRKNGDMALEERDFAEAQKWYEKGVNLGLHIWYDPGITIVQDLITMAILQQGVEGLCDLAVTRGDAVRAAACARFLADTTRYLDQISPFLKKTLARPPQGMTASYKELAEWFPVLDHLPIQVEILLYTAEIRTALPEDEEVQAISNKVIAMGKKHTDVRIQKLAQWAEDVTQADMERFLKKHFPK